MGNSNTKKEEFVRGLVNKYVEIEKTKEKYKEKQTEQYDKLASTIAKLVMKYKQDEDVECIHLEVICDEKIEYDNLYYLYVVCNDTDLDALDEKFKKDNTKYSRKDDWDKLGGWLHIIAAPSYFYDEVSDCYEVAENLLLMNDILYDKTGKYTQIKERANKQYNAEESNKIIVK